MRSVRLSTGHAVALDGELLTVMEALYREVTLKRALDVTFADMMREITAIVDQMDADERRAYLIESLFLNSVTYENEMLDAYARRLTSAPGRRRGRGRDAGSTS